VLKSKARPKFAGSDGLLNYFLLSLPNLVGLAESL
jgi:hypothetical protein